MRHYECEHPGELIHIKKLGNSIRLVIASAAIGPIREYGLPWQPVWAGNPAVAGDDGPLHSEFVRRGALPCRCTPPPGYGTNKASSPVALLLRADLASGSVRKSEQLLVHSLITFDLAAVVAG